jgi:hypothetical protein
MPITWRNIDIGSNAAANQLMGQGIQTLNRGLEGIGDVVEQRDKTNIANWNTAADKTTTDVLTKLDSITDSKSLAAAMAEGGDLNTQALTGKFGAQLDIGKISGLAADKFKSLQAKEKADLRQATQDQYTVEDRAASADARKLSMESSRLSIQNTRINMANSERMLNEALTLDKAKRDLNLKNLEDRKTVTNPEEYLLKVQRNYDEAIEASGGRISAMDAAQGLAAVKAATANVGMTATLENELRTNSVATDAAAKQIVDAFGIVEKRFKTAIGVDDKLLALQADTSVGEADVTNNLTGAIQTKKGDLVDSAKIRPVYEGIRREFRDAGIEPSPRLVQEIMTAGGYDDHWAGGDAEYKPNKAIVRDYIAKTKANIDFSTGSTKENWDLIQKEKNANLAAVLKASQSYTTAVNSTAFANANNAEDGDGKIIIRAPEVTNSVVTKLDEAKAKITQLETALGLTNLEQVMKTDKQKQAELEKQLKSTPHTGAVGAIESGVRNLATSLESN